MCVATAPKRESHLQPPGGRAAGSRSSHFLRAGRREPSAPQRSWAEGGTEDFSRRGKPRARSPSLCRCQGCAWHRGAVSHAGSPRCREAGQEADVFPFQHSTQRHPGLIASRAPGPARLYLCNPLLAPRSQCCGICPSPATSRALAAPPALGRGSPGTDPAGRSRARGPGPAPEQRRSPAGQRSNNTSQCTIFFFFEKKALF